MYLHKGTYLKANETMIRIGFLGAGKMAQALAKGFLSAGLVKSDQIIASCVPEDHLSANAFKELGSALTFDNSEVINYAHIIFLATKPSVVPSVLNDIRSHMSDKKLLISIAMGVTLDSLQSYLPQRSKVIRAMPNTPALVQKGASVFVPGPSVTDADIALTTKFLSSVGSCDRVSEQLLDVVTALSGSGPAYIYVVTEALADGAVRMGMPRDLAYKLTAQTILGAATMLMNTKKHPGKLKDDVTSPGGCTAEGLHILETLKVRAAMIKTIEVATKKSQQISSQMQ